MIPREWFRGWNSAGEGEGDERNPPWTFREKTLALQAEQKSAVRFPSILCFYSRFPLVSRDWKRISQPCCYFQKAVICFYLYSIQSHSTTWYESKMTARAQKRKLKRVTSFLTVHFFVSTAGQEAEIHLRVHVQFYSLRNKVDVQSLSDCQHWICFRLSCRVG